ncbi:MAG: hypothetical protein QM831_18555 [Kofleriaceae bacterium]
MDKKRWSPLKAALVTALLVLIVGAVGAGVYGAATDGAGYHADPEKAGEKVGQALAPVLILAGVIAYFVQKSRLADKK